MARLKVRRTNQYINRYRRYHIFIDGKRAGSIPNGSTRYFDLSAGKHLISARSRWGRGPEIKIEIHGDDEKYLKLGGISQSGTGIISLICIILLLSILAYYFDFEYKGLVSALLFLLVTLYLIVFMPKKHLTFKEIKTDEVGI